MRYTFILGFAGLCLAIALVRAWALGIILFFLHSCLASFIVEQPSFDRGLLATVVVIVRTASASRAAAAIKS